MRNTNATVWRPTTSRKRDRSILVRFTILLDSTRTWCRCQTSSEDKSVLFANHAAMHNMWDFEALWAQYPDYIDPMAYGDSQSGPVRGGQVRDIRCGGGNVHQPGPLTGSIQHVETHGVGGHGIA